MKKNLFFLLSCFGVLNAANISVDSLMRAAETSDIYKYMQMQNKLQSAGEKDTVLSDGYKLRTELDYASPSSGSNELEYHIGIEKNFLTGDAAAYLDALEFSLKQKENLQRNRLKTIFYTDYVKSCANQEKVKLLEDAKEQNTKFSQLIKEGVEGGEFDLSAQLRSELSVDELQSQIDVLNAKNTKNINRLKYYLNTDSVKLECNDLQLQVFKVDTKAELEADSLIFVQMQSEIAKQSALSNFADNSLHDLSVGVGYDKEIGIKRATLFVQIPLTNGDSLNNMKQKSRLAKLESQKAFALKKREIESQLHTYVKQQEQRRKMLDRLNDDLILKAYKTSIILQDRFLGSEGTYLEFIDSQKVLFDLLKQSIDLKTEILLEKARIDNIMGIDPKRNIK